MILYCRSTKANREQVVAAAAVAAKAAVAALQVPPLQRQEERLPPRGLRRWRQPAGARELQGSG